MSVQPSRTTVISVAAATALLVAGTAATAIGTSYRHVTVEVDGVTHDVSGFFTTAGDALSTAGVSVGAHDLVAPASDQSVANGDTVVVRTATEYNVTVDGNVTVSAVLSTTRTEPTKRIVSKGTKAKKVEDTASKSSSSSDSSGSSASSSSASAPAAVSGDDAAIWAAIAQCESGGNPSINTGNGYYGMYQFSLPTWRSVGGSGLPSDASAEEQTMRARMLQQRSGWGQWGCAYKLGLV